MTKAAVMHIGATKKDMGDTYDYLGKVMRYMPSYVDLTNCIWKEETDTLADAQKRKFDFLINGLGLKPGMSVLEIGCGCGRLGKYLKSIGLHYVGITPSHEQVEICRAAGLEVYETLYQNFHPKEKFDAMIFMGPTEHFCTPDDNGHQAEIYRQFFQFAKEYTKEGARVYLQSMMFPENKIPDPEKVFNATKPSDPLYYSYLLTWFYPGSWLGTLSQYDEGAKGLYKRGETIDGRKMYIKTMTMWGKEIYALNPFRKNDWLKWFTIFECLARSLVNKRLRMQLKSLSVSANKKCFEHETMTHYFAIWEPVNSI